MSRPNYQDIARLAGVGTATVERVLNGRGGVRSELVEKVTLAARTLKYPRTIPDAHHKLLRIEVLMVRPETTFYRRLSHEFESIASTLDPWSLFSAALRMRKTRRNRKANTVDRRSTGGPDTGRAQ